MAAGTSSWPSEQAFYSGPDDVRRISADLNRYGEICRKNGMDFYYHNHFQEFQRFGGKTVLETILELTDENLSKIELDMYLAVRGGAEAA